jgi:MFS family permease
MYVSVQGLSGVHAGARATAGRRVSGTVVLLGLTSMFTDVSSEMVAAVLPLFATAQLALTPLAYGVVDGLYHGVAALVRVAGGFVADRSRRPKAVAVAGYGLSAVCRLALLPVTSGGALSAVVAADRVGKGIRTAPRDALIAAASDVRMLGRAFGVHRALDTAGALAGPLLAFAILAAIPQGFDTVFLVSFAAALVGLGILVFLVPALHPTVATQADAQPLTLTAVARLAVEPRVLRLLGVAALLSALTIGDGFLYLALQRREEFAVAYFPLLFVGTAVTYLMLAVPFGRLADRFGRLRVFVTGHVLLMLAYLLAGGTMSGPITVLACLACLGAYYAATDGVLAAATAALVPQQLWGSGLALAQTTVAAGRFLAAIGFGAAWTWAGRDTALTVFAGTLAVGIPVAAVLLHRMHR